jgi:hypothetical protein
LGPDQDVDIYQHILSFASGDTGTYVSTAFVWQVGDSANTVQEMVVTAKITSPTGIADIALGSATLLQNAPNPFKSMTTISYQLSGEKGKLTVQDLTGKLVKEIPLNQRSGIVAIQGNLNAGVYFYSLWENGAIIDSKRMQVID